MNMMCLLILIGAASSASCSLTPGLLDSGVCSLLPIDETKQRGIVDFDIFPDKSLAPQKTYSWSEVSSCDGEDGRKMFIVFDDNVYDVTDFAEFHPPGPQLLKRLAGQDATEAMKASSMPTEVFNVILKRFLVGRIIKMADLQRYTMAEVAVKKGRNGQPLWLVYKDSVYDVTKYVAEHPGGDEVLMDEGGTDATKAFDNIGHSQDAKTVMAKFKIGELVEEEKRYDANGKKKKVVNAEPEKSNRSCISVVTCGLLG